MRFDHTDQALVRHLQSRARMTNRALAAAVGLAPSSTLARVRELEHSNVIRGYHADVDLGHLGRPLQALVSVRLQPKTQAIVERFIEHVWAMPETVGVMMISGGDDVLVHLAVADTDTLRETVLGQISSFEGVVDERTSLLFEYRRKFVVDTL